MSARPIIDAGPGLNFLSVNKERLLISVLGPLSAPETVQDEVFRKSAQDSRFRAAATVWRKLSPRWIQILSDDATPELAAVVHQVPRSPPWKSTDWDGCAPAAARWGQSSWQAH